MNHHSLSNGSSPAVMRDAELNSEPMSRHRSESRESAVKADKVEPIAIIGFAARLPQDASSAEAFWQMLCEGRSARTEIPRERFNIDAFYHPDADRIDTTNVRTGHFLTGDIAAFDAPFFSIQPTEVASMDPQQRCMLETSYQALENAGIPMDSIIRSKTCVYVGSSARDYEALLLRDPESPAKYLGTGIGTSLLANRLSWFYDLQGPSIALDTACSSSLSALHLACQSLRSHESSMGLVGGCNLILAPDVSMIHLSNMGFFSPDGVCYSFDDRANGYAKGEGVGVVVLKRLADALNDGDTIRAIIRATGANQDGRTPGITQPSKLAQENNIKETYCAGGLNLDETSFFEAHGTGTQIGDPIEAGAINAAFQRGKGNPLYIGALKPNIGHLESGSGVASLIKTVLVLEKGLIPPNIGFKRPNSGIPADDWNLKFPVEPTPWPTDGLRRASVNSFGYGGANAHIVLDDAFNYLRIRGIKGRHSTAKLPPRCENFVPPKDSTSPIANTNGNASSRPSEQPRVFIWSASDEEGLKRLATAYQTYLSRIHKSGLGDHRTYLENLSYTLSNKRSNLPWKAYTVACSVEGLRQNLSTKLSKPIRSPTVPVVSFVFTGQGAQWVGMGAGLSMLPEYRASLQRSDSCLQALGCEWSVMDKLSPHQDPVKINSPAIAQPLCTALQIALVDLMTSLAIFPVAVVGHSSGEIAAAYCAGGLSQESALKVAFYRGSLAARLAAHASNPGAMISVALSESEIAPYLAKIISIPGNRNITVGCVNSPKNVTVTGDSGSIETLNRMMDEKGIFAKKLPVNVAYHSYQMMEVASEYLNLIESINPRTCLPCVRPKNYAIVAFSSVTGTKIPVTRFGQAEYWVTNMVQQVRFADALNQMSSYLMDDSASAKKLLLEIGPHSALQRPVKDTIDEIGVSNRVEYDSILKRDSPGSETFAEVIGRIRCRGYMVDLVSFNCPESKEQDLRMLVDLPEYPFNHSQSFWYESRVSKNFRMRKYARHDFLGTPSADWNSLEPKWRNIIRTSENPWIRDHKIDGTELYPAAGMIVMVVEAIRQLANPEKTITGYRLTDVTFSKALLISPDSDGIETQLHFRPHNRATNGVFESNDFKIYMHSNEEWSSVCTGTITMEYEAVEIEVEDRREPQYAQSHLREICKAIAKDCKDTVNSSQLYKNLATFGFDYGMSFQPLRRIYYSDDGKATATINLDAWKVKQACERSSEHVIHPATLDGILQLTMVALSKGGWLDIPSMVPTQLRSLWISNDLLASTTDAKIEVFARTTFSGYREADFWIAALNYREEAQMLVEGWREMALSSLNGVSQKSRPRLCYHTEWKPDIDLLDSHQVVKFCEAGVNSSDIPPEAVIDRLELVCLYFMSSTLKAIPSEGLETLSTHLQKYLDWMQYQFQQRDLDAYLSIVADGKKLTSGDEHRERYLNEFANSSPEGALSVTVGRNLMRVLRGELDALDLLFNGNLVQDFYHSPAFSFSYARITRYVDLLAHKNPNLRILEIGAGTGAATTPILDCLSSYSNDYGQEEGIPRFSQYVYTDISPAFFGEAKDRFQKYLDRMKFTVLDIEKDPKSQGFEPEQYDLIICGLVLHATANLNTTLQNTRKLLKPGGKLILFEPSNVDCSRVSFIFGLLPGWWLSTEEKRKWGPLLSDTDWHETLLDNGFSGANVCLPDYHDPRRQTFSAIISTAIEPVQKVADHGKIHIIVDKACHLQDQVAHQLNSSIQSSKISAVEIIDIQDAKSKDLKRSLCISLLELDTSFLSEMSPDQFMNLKFIITTASALLWVTQGCGEHSSKPDLGLVTGLGRVINSENWSFRFIELALESEQSISRVAELIIKTSRQSMIPIEEGGESEYMQRDGKLCISRIIEAPHLNDSVYTKITRQQHEMCRFSSESKRALKLSISSPGLLDTLQFEDDDRAETLLEADEVEIEVRATGMNFKDVMVALGQIPGNSLGYECAGIVTRIGGNGDLRPGDRVCCCTTTGSYNTFVRAHTTSVAKIPTDLPFCTAAAIPVVYSTAYYSLHNLANLQEGEIILIHSGAGGIGQAAIQLAKLSKAHIYTTVGTNEKKKLLMDLYQIPEKQIFSSRNQTFARSLMRMTGGVDVVLNSLSGEGLRASWSCLKPFGRFIELGKADIQSGDVLSMSPFSYNVLFASVDLGLVMEKSKSIMGATMKAVMSLLTSNPPRIAAPQPLHVYKMSELEKAFRLMQSGKSMGKIVVEMQEDAIVPIVPSVKASYKFECDATYVISGGLGGLGRSITGWMVDRGARHFILLSRSGSKSKVALDFLEDMRLRNVTIVAPPCDISNEQAVSTVLTEHAMITPRIKGCIQAAMVLKDGLFENMTKEDFDAALAPKVKGSWHLHKYLPRGMDFFILLSSVAGVTGSRGQSNYASGNAYQDALARYRVSMGEKCTALDLGSILSVGFAAEMELTESLEADGFQGIRKAELFALLDHFCNPSLKLPSPLKSQVITGLGGIENLQVDRLHEVYWTRKPLFSVISNMKTAESTANTASNETVDYRSLLVAAASPVEATEIITQALKQKLSLGLSIPIDDVDSQKPIYAFGIDSLVALEVRYWFMKEMKSEVTIFDVMQSKSIQALCEAAAEKSEYCVTSAAITNGNSTTIISNPSAN